MNAGLSVVSLIINLIHSLRRKKMRTTTKSRMMIGASLLVMTFSFTMNANAETCTQVPTCAELGFTKTSCLGDSLKCPFDQTKLFCGEKCKAGDIYYSDNTCSEDYNSSKTVVGVVGGVVRGNGIIVDIAANTPRFDTWEKATSACYWLTWGGKRAHLPSLRELKKIFLNFDAIERGLAKIPGAISINYSCWSSEISGTGFGIDFNTFSGSYYSAYSADESHHVRCVFNF